MSNVMNILKLVYFREVQRWIFNIHVEETISSEILKKFAYKIHTFRSNILQLELLTPCVNVITMHIYKYNSVRTCYTV